MDVRVSVQAAPQHRSSWLQLARAVEAAGLDALYAADHPGSAPAPFVALAAAAAVTERIVLGSCVVNAGAWEPLALANAVATLDVVSGGRALLGVGAGHTPSEWTSVGHTFPSPAARVDRMIEVIEATQSLLAGRPTSYDGRHVTLVDALLDSPRPEQHQVPLLVGGAGSRVLRYAARHAGIVGISGLGRTLADGHHHEVDWSERAVNTTLDTVLSAARTAGTSPEIEALVQAVEITDDPVAAAERLAPHVPGARVDDVLAAPFVWIGSVDEISAKLERFRALGIGRYVIRPGALANARAILDAAR